ncbi:MAG: hypothetical protein Kow0013_21960 [Pararhodobacter sp.]
MRRRGEQPNKARGPARDAEPGRGAGQTLRLMISQREWLWRKSGLVFAGFLALVIASLTLTPLPGGISVPGGIDKVYHFVAFTALIFPLILTDSRRWFWAVPAAILYGGAIELIQPTVGRTAELLDFGADITGVLAGAALAEILHDRIRATVFELPDAPVSPEDTGESDADRMEAMRAELMAEMRRALREELSSYRDEGEDAVGPSPAEEAEIARPLRVVGR